MAAHAEVLVVGAGLAGLAVAHDLQAAGREVVVVERAAGPGGRVATDVVDGFRIDRGFQVLNTAYPQVQRRLDLDKLDVRPLTAGALVRHDGRLRPIGNPLRNPGSAPSTVGAHLLPISDLLHLGAYSARVSGPMRLLPTEDIAAAEAFLRAKLGHAAIDRFVGPFLAGVLLESELATSRRFVDLVWRTFVRGQSVLPAAGMATIGTTLAEPIVDLRLGLETFAVRPDGIDTSDGTISADTVVVATDPTTAATWLGLEPPRMRSVTTFYFSPPTAPLAEPTIVLDGERTGPVINTIVLTAAVPEYAPPGRHLVSASILNGATEADVRTHLAHLYAQPADDWPLVARQEVRDALPSFPPGTPIRREPTVNGIYVAGDHRATPSIQGALASGAAVARAVLSG